jgi:hypothetical protein
MSRDTESSRWPPYTRSTAANDREENSSVGLPSDGGYAEYSGFVDPQYLSNSNGQSSYDQDFSSEFATTVPTTVSYPSHTVNQPWYSAAALEVPGTSPYQNNQDQSL